MANDTASLMVESVFLAKLLASGLYGDPVDGLRDRLIERAPNGLTEECLLQAVETVMRSHGSGAFPKLPACIRAIEDAYRSPRGSAPHSAPIGFVDARNYTEAAMKYIRSRYKSDDLPVIDKIADPEKWEAWAGYFEMIGLRATVGMMATTAKRWTVPAQWPWEFDGSYVHKPQAQPPEAYSYSREVSQEVKNAMDTMRAQSKAGRALNHDAAKAKAIKEAEDASRSELILRAADGDPEAMAAIRAENINRRIARKDEAA